MSEANVAIMLTAAGPAAIAVVRLAGPGVEAFLQTHFRGKAEPNRPIHGTLHDGDRIIDDPIILLDSARQIVDINLHGGAWVIQSTLDLARRDGFQILDSTELPLHPLAVDADSIIKSEMLTHLPLARTELAIRILLAQPAEWDKLKSRHDVSTDEINSILNDRSLHWLLHPPRVAIVGAPNVGKSTLANQLFAQQRSITAPIAGTTRDWVGELANLDGLAVMLIDTPGQRVTGDAIEHAAITRSAPQIHGADLVLLVLSAADSLDQDQKSLLIKFPSAMHVINKIDLARSSSIREVHGYEISALVGTGIEELRRGIRAYFGCDMIDLDRPRAWTDRQRDILKRAIISPEILAEM